jgi:hypothetical protein
MLDLELDEDEMHYVALKMLHPAISGNQNLHYPSLVKWINDLATKKHHDVKHTSNIKTFERYF